MITDTVGFERNGCGDVLIISPQALPLARIGASIVEIPDRRADSSWPSVRVAARPSLAARYEHHVHPIVVIRRRGRERRCAVLVHRTTRGDRQRAVRVRAGK